MAVGGPVSRIPIPIQKKPPVHQRTVSAPSKLEKLQARYQERLYQNREERLVQILQGRQGPPFTQTGNGSEIQVRGNLRNFFHQRRENNAADLGKTGPGHKTYGGWTGKPPVYKNSVGRDRAKPLAPIDRPSSLPGSASLRQRSVSAGSVQLGSVKHTPTPPPIEQKPKAIRNNRRYLGAASNANGNEIGDLRRQPALMPIKTVPNNQPVLLNRTKLKPLGKPVAGHSRTASNYESPPKMSGFAKWQMEQDQARDQRLKKHMAETNRDNSDLHNSMFDDDMNNNQFSYRSEQSVSRNTPSKSKWQNKLKDTQDVQKQKRKVLAARNRRFSNADSDDDGTATLGRSFAPSSLSTARSNKPPESSRSPGRSRAGKSGRETALEEELRKKEEQLMAMIQQQQAELAQLQTEKAEEEEQERKQQAEVKKREAAQNMRQNRLKEAEQRKRMASQPSPLPSTRSQISHHSPAPPKQSPKPQQKQNRRRSNARPKPLPPRDPSPEEFVRDTSTAAPYLEMAEMMDSEANAQVDLASCANCGRKFARDRLPKHAKVCKDAAKKAAKRKVFDPVKMRLEGTGAEKYVNNVRKEPAKKPKKNNWKAKHEEFLKTIRYARKVSEVEQKGGNLADLPPPPPSENPDYVQCPHCQRKFNSSAAERHIPKCKDIKAKPAPLKRRGR